MRSEKNLIIQDIDNTQTLIYKILYLNLYYLYVFSLLAEELEKQL